MNARETQLFPLLRPGPSPKVPVKTGLVSTTRTDPYPTLCFLGRLSDAEMETLYTSNSQLSRVVRCVSLSCLLFTGFRLFV